jgi:hypothetical protein
VKDCWKTQTESGGRFDAMRNIFFVIVSIFSAMQNLVAASV